MSVCEYYNLDFGKVVFERGKVYIIILDLVLSGIKDYII